MGFNKNNFILYGDVVNESLHEAVLRQINNLSTSYLYFHHVNLSKHSDREEADKLEGYKKIPGKVVVFFYCVNTPVLLIRFLQHVWAAKYQYGAKKIVVLLDFMRYRRQEHSEDKYFDQINRNKWFLYNMKTNGVDTLVLVDIHNQKTLDYAREYGLNIYHVDPTRAFVDYLQSVIDEFGIENIIARAPDRGSIPRVVSLVREMKLRKWDIPVSLGSKVRLSSGDTLHINTEEMIKEYSSQYEDINFIYLDDFTGKVIITREDEISTGGTANKDTHNLLNLNAAKVVLVSTHPVCAPSWKENLFYQNPFYKVFLGNTIERGLEDRTKGLITEVNLSLPIATDMVKVLRESLDD